MQHPDKKSRPQVLLITRVIIAHQGKILIIQRAERDPYAPAKWEFPGGKLDIGDDLNHAFEREAFEETCLVIKPVDKCAYIESTILTQGKYAGLPYIEIFGVAEKSAGEVKLSEEHQSSAWVSIDEAKNYDFQISSHKALIALEERLKGHFSESSL